MKKVFLVDDEIAVREGIRDCINWEREGFEYCGDASDGEVALPLIEQLKPDILITDICMPFMDGLQISRIIRSKMPWIKIIILSGHDEFDYAREALRIHVNEYCLKPLSAADLLQILRQVSKQIDHEEMEKKHLNELKEQALQSLSLSREKLLNELCKGTLSAASAIEQAGSLNVDLVSKYYQVMILETESVGDPSHVWITEQCPCLHYKRNKKEIVYILKGDTVDQLEKHESAIRKRLLAEAECNNTFPLNFGFGTVKDRIQCIASSFSEADEEKSYLNTLHKYGLSVLPQETGQFISKKESYRFDGNQLIHFLKYGERNQITEFSQTYASHLKETDFRATFFIYYFLMNVTLTVTHYIEELEMENCSVLEQIGLLEGKISLIKDFVEVINYIEDILHLVIEMREQSNNKYSAIILRAKDYIHQHHDKPDISLHTVASHVNVSPSYFSHIFSQETNQTFIEYLTMTRINRAKELLKTTHDKTYEIAHKVGYTDPHYFCHLFKKVTGMTTRKFKSQGQFLSL